MFSLMDKKGMSNIVASAFLVLLGVIAVGLFSVYVFQFFSSPNLAPALDCFDLQLNRQISLEKACYNTNTGDIEVNVRRLGDGYDIERIYFVVNSLEARRYCCGGECNSCNVLEDSSSKDYFLSGSSQDIDGNILLDIYGCEVDSRKIEIC